jgi:hypothetical protein
LWDNKKCFDTVDARYKHEDYDVTKFLRNVGIYLPA